jgi:hypothetical protein
MSAVWWTPADQAELDVLIWELVERVPEHRERCRRCLVEKETGFPCTAVTEAIEAVLEWRRARWLLSKAQYLRRLEEAA